MIIDGKIGLKNDSTIKEFTKTGLRFEDGSTLDADLVVLATGFGDYRDGFRKLLGKDLGGEVKQIWGLDGEGEPMGAWRDVGVENLWCMMGNLAMARYHSRHVALRKFFSAVSPLRCVDGCGSIEIKAVKEGLFTNRYSLGEGEKEGPSLAIAESPDHVESAISVSKHPKASKSMLSKARTLLRKAGIILKFPRSGSQKWQ